MKCRRFIEAVLWLCLTASPAGADAFKDHYEAGLSRYSSEEYEEAVKEFQAAYALKPKPRLLFNIGQSYRSLGNAREALHFYLLYQAMESNPKPGLKTELERYIDQMKSIVDQAERARQAEEREAPAPSPVVVVTAPLVEAKPPLSPPLQESPPPRKRGWIWGVAAGAVAVTVLSIGLGVGLSVGREPSYGGEIRHPTF